jgi:surfactin synthase thioesterase subunit
MTVVDHSQGRWLLRRPSVEKNFRLFCFPYSGVGASMYRGWPERVGEVEICPVQLPGRENRIREPLLPTYEELADAAAAGLGPELRTPSGFFGHCGGALAAFATALALERAGLPAPLCLFVSSQVAPHEGPFGRFLSMTGGELRSELEQLTVAMGGQPLPDTIDLGLEVLRSDVAANQRYRLSAPEVLTADVHAIGWTRDAEIRPEQMTGWREYAAPGRFSAPVLEGEHHTFLHAPVALLDIVRRGLAKAARAR